MCQVEDCTCTNHSGNGIANGFANSDGHRNPDAYSYFNCDPNSNRNRNPYPKPNGYGDSIGFANCDPDSDTYPNGYCNSDPNGYTNLEARAAAG